MYLTKHNDITLPVIVLLMSTLFSSRVTAVSEGHKITSNLLTIVIIPKSLML